MNFDPQRDRQKCQIWAQNAIPRHWECVSSLWRVQLSSVLMQSSLIKSGANQGCLCVWIHDFDDSHCRSPPLTIAVTQSRAISATWVVAAQDCTVIKAGLFQSSCLAKREESDLLLLHVNRRSISTNDMRTQAACFEPGPARTHFGISLGFTLLHPSPPNSSHG